MNVHASAKTRIREIGSSDIVPVAALLAKGFASRSDAFWRAALEQLAHRPTPENCPPIGYMLERANAPVGVLLLIYSAMGEGAARTLRCNVSSWYVEPELRSLAPFLVSRALKPKNITFLNVSSVPHTRPIVEAQGFARYCDGMFVGVPALKRGGPRTRVTEAQFFSPGAGDGAEHRLLLDHAQFGCVSLWCEAQGLTAPFVFRPRRVKRLVPCLQLVYCRAFEDFTRFAGPLGRVLGMRGWPLVVTDAEGPLPGIPGRFFAGTLPKYFRGPQRPRLGDLAYTETAMFGF